MTEICPDHKNKAATYFYELCPIEGTPLIRHYDKSGKYCLRPATEAEFQMHYVINNQNEEILELQNELNKIKNALILSKLKKKSGGELD